MIQNINDILSFLIELVVIYLYAWEAYNVPDTLPKKILFAVIAIIIFAFIWGLFFSPKARYPISGLLGWTLKFFILFLAFIPLAISRLFFVIMMAIVIIFNLYIQSLK